MLRRSKCVSMRRALCEKFLIPGKKSAFVFSYNRRGLRGNSSYKFYEYQAFIATQQRGKKRDFLRVST